MVKKISSFRWNMWRNHDDDDAAEFYVRPNTFI